MSGSTMKQTRRALRKVAGITAVETIAEAQANIARLSNSLSLAHKRIDDLEKMVREIDWRGTETPA